MHFTCDESCPAIRGIKIAFVAHDPSPIDDLSRFVSICFFERDTEPHVRVELAKFVHNGVANVLVR